VPEPPDLIRALPRPNGPNWFLIGSLSTLVVGGLAYWYFWGGGEQRVREFRRSRGMGRIRGPLPRRLTSLDDDVPSRYMLEVE
jgi:hypothetical protein